MSDVIRRIQNRPKADPQMLFAKEIAAHKRAAEARAATNRTLLIGTGLSFVMAFAILGPLYFLGVIPPR